jgi:two-component system OmpR family response regulator
MIATRGCFHWQTELERAMIEAIDQQASEQALQFKAFVVEDNPAICASLVSALEELAGLQVVGTTGSAPQAVAWLTDPGNAWDLAIVDLLLEPGGTGLDVLRACRLRNAGQKMVVLTATASDLVRHMCESLGSDGVFDKATETETLLQWCATLSGGAAPSPSPGVASP